MRSHPLLRVSRAATTLAAIAALAVVTACGSDTNSALAPTAPAQAAGSVVRPSRYPLVFSAYDQSCSLVDGVARCWGYNREGELGDGTTTDRLVPTAVAGGIEFASLAMSDWSTCGLTAAGKAYCWGLNYSDALGVGSTNAEEHSPMPVVGNDVFVQISIGVSHQCGLTADGETKCWGFFTGGPQTVAAPKFESITHGATHTCGLTRAGEAYCWDNYNSYNFGQLGYGTNDASDTPLPVVGGIRFASVAAGYNHTCGLDTHGRAYCWGRNYIGQLGDGTTDDKLEPTPVATTLRFTEIRGGNSHTCALTRQGDAYCWGNGYSGQLGNGVSGSSTTPVPVSGGIRFRSLAGAGGVECGVARDGAIYCWGWNFFGGVGDGTTTDRLEPTLIAQ